LEQRQNNVTSRYTIRDKHMRSGDSSSPPWPCDRHLFRSMIRDLGGACLIRPNSPARRHHAQRRSTLRAIFSSSRTEHRSRAVFGADPTVRLVMATRQARSSNGSISWTSNLGCPRRNEQKSGQVRRLPAYCGMRRSSKSCARVRPRGEHTADNQNPRRMGRRNRTRRGG